VIVVGTGAAGEAEAGSLAEAGLQVIGIDRELFGGECPYWGCVPSKLMIRPPLRCEPWRTSHRPRPARPDRRVPRPGPGWRTSPAWCCTGPT
jgi:pyruvate/2-oxoglutarate dehydrogenase complex dihydrolipoamide dehydrogenase (E3) component